MHLHLERNDDGVAAAMAVSGSPPRPRTQSMSLFTSRRPAIQYVYSNKSVRYGISNSFRLVNWSLRFLANPEADLTIPRVDLSPPAQP